MSYSFIFQFIYVFDIVQLSLKMTREVKFKLTFNIPNNKYKIYHRWLHISNQVAQSFVTRISHTPKINIPFAKLVVPNKTIILLHCDKSLCWTKYTQAVFLAHAASEAFLVSNTHLPILSSQSTSRFRAERAALPPS